MKSPKEKCLRSRHWFLFNSGTNTAIRHLSEIPQNLSLKSNPILIKYCLSRISAKTLTEIESRRKPQSNHCNWIYPHLRSNSAKFAGSHFLPRKHSKIFNFCYYPYRWKDEQTRIYTEYINVSNVLSRYVEKVATWKDAVRG